jgi:hypothetical protein
VFGRSFTPGKLKWSDEGSTLSKREFSPRSRYHGIDPVRNDEAIEQLVKDAAAGIADNNIKVFTLVDTRSMTATLFTAERPPVTAFACGYDKGQRGSHERVVLCSYDREMGVSWREMVVRMGIEAVSSMSDVKQFRFGLKRKTC